MRRVLLGFSLVAAAVVAVAAGSGAPVAHALPAGFSDVLVTNVPRPTAVEYLPNGRVVVLEQHTGNVRLIDTATGALLPVASIRVSVCTGNEQGLLGFTHDPTFTSGGGRVYLYYTTVVGGSCRNRVSAFTMTGDSINPATEQVLIEIPTIRTNHNGGDLEVGNDGYLYVAVGDGGADPRGNSGGGGANDAAQDRSILNGKILRLDRFTGAPAPGNPFENDPNAIRCGSIGTGASLSAVCNEIFAFGLRNAFRFAFDPNTPATRLFANDVGQSGNSQREEVNEIVAGGNFGWNVCEGPCGQPGLIDPLTSYTRNEGQFITGGAFVPDGSWPAEYDGGYFFADGGSGKMWFRDGAGSPVDYADPFLEDRFGIADMAFVLEANGWAMYYTQNGNGNVRKITTGFAAPTPSGPLSFDRLPAIRRALDTRAGATPSPIRGGQTRFVFLGADAVGAKAALVNITPIAPSDNSFSTVWEPRTARPSTSNVNAGNNEIVANASIVPLDAGGRLLYFTGATSHVLIDVIGFFRDAPGPVASGRFAAVEPTRLLDSRQPSSVSNPYTRGPFADGEKVNLPVGGRAGVPATGVGSVALVVTGLAPAGGTPGFLTAFAGGTPLPDGSNINLNGNSDVRANTVIAPLGADGSIDVFLQTVDNVLVDVVGWFTDGTAPASTAGRFHLLPPTREADSRSNVGFGPLPNGTTATINPGSVPDGASAIAQNLTFAPSGGWGFVTAFPGPGVPTVSNINATAAGQVRAALSLTPLGAGGTVSYFSGEPFEIGPHQLVVDAFGYFE